MSNSLLTPWTADARLPCPSPTLELAQTYVHWVNDAIQLSHLCRPLLLPSILPTIRVFFNESVLHIRWPKYWSFNFSISPSKEYSRLISFRIDWFYLLAVQGPFKSLLQHHSSKASILQCSAFFMFQLSSYTINNLKEEDILLCFHLTASPTPITLLSYNFWPTKKCFFFKTVSNNYFISFSKIKFFVSSDKWGSSLLSKKRNSVCNGIKR